MNCKCSYINKIILLNEKDLSHEWINMTGCERIEQIIIRRRLAYADLIQITRDRIPPNTIVIWSNADIYCTDTIGMLWTVNMHDKMFALLRWDEQADGNEPVLYNDTERSQDTWIVLSDSIKQRQWNLDTLNYKLGTPGCDNKFAFDMFRNRFCVSNPCNSIKMIHSHQSQIRAYSIADTVFSDVYLYLAPCDIKPSNYIKNIQHPYEKYINMPFPISIKSSSPSNAITFCTMVARDGQYVWEYDIDNFYTEEMRVYTIPNAMVNCRSLIYDTHNMFIGNDDKANAILWNNAEINTAASSIYKKTMITVPVLSYHTFIHTDMYCLEYLSRVARIKSQYPDGAFYISPSATSIINSFKFNCEHINGVPWSPSANVYADNVVGFVANTYKIGREDIQALRSIWPDWKESPTEEKVCIVQYEPSTLQDEHSISSAITKEYAESLRPLFGDSWTLRFIPSDIIGLPGYEALAGASLYIVFGGVARKGKWAKLWALPRNAKVIELQNELEMSGEMQHVAHAAELTSWIFPLHKGGATDVQNQLTKALTRWISKNLQTLNQSPATIPTSATPTELSS